MDDAEDHPRRHPAERAPPRSGDGLQLDDRLFQAVVVEIFARLLPPRVDEFVDDRKPLLRLREAGLHPDLVPLVAHVEQAVKRGLRAERRVRDLAGQRAKPPEVLLPDHVPPAREARESSDVLGACCDPHQDLRLRSSPHTLNNASGPPDVPRGATGPRQHAAGPLLYIPTRGALLAAQQGGISGRRSSPVAEEVSGSDR